MAERNLLRRRSLGRYCLVTSIILAALVALAGIYSLMYYVTVEENYHAGSHPRLLVMFDVLKWSRTAYGGAGIILSPSQVLVPPNMSIENQIVTHVFYPMMVCRYFAFQSGLIPPTEPDNEPKERLINYRGITIGYYDNPNREITDLHLDLDDPAVAFCAYRMREHEVKSVLHFGFFSDASECPRPREGAAHENSLILSILSYEGVLYYVERDPVTLQWSVIPGITGRLVY